MTAQPADQPSPGGLKQTPERRLTGDDDDAFGAGLTSGCLPITQYDLGSRARRTGGIGTSRRETGDHAEVRLIALVTVETITLDAFCELHKIPKIDCLKVDIERAWVSSVSYLILLASIRAPAIGFSGRRATEGNDHPSPLPPLATLFLGSGVQCPKDVTERRSCPRRIGGTLRLLTPSRQIAVCWGI